jgi:type I pantothenate kinase
VHRFVQHALRANDEPGGFWDLFAGMDAERLRESALFTWTAINLPNLLDHVEPTRVRADVVVTKAADHSVTSITLR